MVDFDGEGNDTITGRGYANWIHGGDGDDTITISAEEPQIISVLQGGDGDDTIDGSLSFLTFIEGGGGNDTLTGSAGLASVLIGDVMDFPMGIDPELEVNFEYDREARANFTGLWSLVPSKFSISADASALKFTEDGNDTLIGGDGLINIMVGCDGDDTLHGNGQLFNLMLGDEFNLGLAVEYELDFTKLIPGATSEDDEESVLRRHRTARPRRKRQRPRFTAATGRSTSRSAVTARTPFMAAADWSICFGATTEKTTSRVDRDSMRLSAAMTTIASSAATTAT